MLGFEVDRRVFLRSFVQVVAASEGRAGANPSVKTANAVLLPHLAQAHLDVSTNGAAARRHEDAGSLRLAGSPCRPHESGKPPSAACVLFAIDEECLRTIAGEIQRSRLDHEIGAVVHLNRFQRGSRFGYRSRRDRNRGDPHT